MHLCNKCGVVFRADPGQRVIRVAAAVLSDIYYLGEEIFFKGAKDTAAIGRAGNYTGMRDLNLFIGGRRPWKACPARADNTLFTAW